MPWAPLRDVIFGRDLFCLGALRVHLRRPPGLCAGLVAPPHRPNDPAPARGLRLLVGSGFADSLSWAREIGGDVAGRHVALIRGINVGRAKRVAMADLRTLLAGLGYREVRTLLNSGNVVFSAGRGKPSHFGKQIEAAMAERLGVSAPVIVLTAAALSTVVEENELVRLADNPARLLVAFSGDADHLERLQPLTRQEWRPEALAVGSRAAYLWCPAGVLASRLFEAVGRVLGELATTRNWATVTKIHAAL